MNRVGGKKMWAASRAERDYNGTLRAMCSFRKGQLLRSHVHSCETDSSRRVSPQSPHRDRQVEPELRQLGVKGKLWQEFGEWPY